MTDYPTLKNAPIVEALVDIQVVFSDPPPLTSLEAVQDGIQKRYPKREERLEYQFGVQPVAGGVPEMIPPTGGSVGFLFTSSDKKNVLQARRDGFTFSRLKPYGEGGEFRREARELWQHYISVMKPSRVTRIALRNINRIEIPLPFNDFKEYLRTVPEVAPGLPQGLARFFMQFVIPHPEMPMTAVVTSTMQPVIEARQMLPLIFDIDVFQQVDIAPDDESVWTELEQIRQYRNDIFFGSMTEKAMRLFQ